MNDDGRGSALSAREREIMDVIFRRGAVTVADLAAELSDAPTDSAIRTMLLRLEAKEQVTRERDGARNVYRARVAHTEARNSALDRLVATFFSGSPLAAAAALIDRSSEELDDEELDRLAELVGRTRREQEADEARESGTETPGGEG